MADIIFKIEIITPDRVFYKGETDFLEFNTQSGEVGVYKNVSRAEAAKERAEKRLENHTAQTDIKRAEYALRKALIRIDAAHHV